MNTGPDNPTPRGSDPDAMLTPEERALADHIVRTGPQREPSPALDARILAAARAAVAVPAASASRRHPRARRRWPVVAGAAATLVLAVGLAWQLRPVDDTRVQYSEAPRAVSAMTTSPGGPQAADDEPRAEGAAPTSDAIQAPRKMAPAMEAETPPPAEEPAPPVQKAVEVQPAPGEPPVVFDEPSPMDTPAPSPLPAPAAAPSPTPPPPAAPAGVFRQVPMPQATPADTAATAASVQGKAQEHLARSQAGDAATMAGAAKPATATGTRVVEPKHANPANAASEADAADSHVLDRIEVTGTRVDRFGDQPLDDQPPASADSPQVQQAWLRRVRQLVAEGQLDAARDSLHEYQRRYPRAVLPDDLRALLEE